MLGGMSRLRARRSVRSAATMASTPARRARDASARQEWPGRKSGSPATGTVVAPTRTRTAHSRRSRVHDSTPISGSTRDTSSVTVTSRSHMSR
jgi:hypothetical protein